jgi:hypothetical protein
LLIGANDIVLPDADLERFRTNLVKLVTMIREIGAIPVLQTYNTMILFRNPQTGWQHDYVKRYREFPAYNDVIREVSSACDTILVDHDAYWQKYAADSRIMSFWMDEHLHPGPRGHQEMARLIIRTLGLGENGSVALSISAGGEMPESMPESKELAALLKEYEKVVYLIDDGPQELAKRSRWSNPQSTGAVVDDFFRLDQRGGKGGLYYFSDPGLLAGLTGKVVLEMEMRIADIPDMVRTNRFYLGLVSGSGSSRV